MFLKLSHCRDLSARTVDIEFIVTSSYGQDLGGQFFTEQKFVNIAVINLRLEILSKLPNVSSKVFALCTALCAFWSEIRPCR